MYFFIILFFIVHCVKLECSIFNFRGKTVIIEQNGREVVQLDHYGEWQDEFELQIQKVQRKTRQMIPQRLYFFPKEFAFSALRFFTAPMPAQRFSAKHGGESFVYSFH